MGFLFGSSKAPSTAQQAPTILSAISVQTSVYGLAIPIVYGTNRISGNLIGYNDFLATAHSSATAAASGGKGGGSSGGSQNAGTPTYTYSATIQIGLCEGPIDGIGQVWQDKNLTSLAALGLSLFTGTNPQTAWSYLSSNYPAQALGYNNLAYVAGTSYQLDTNAGMQNNSFEIQGLKRFNPGSSIIDANPADIVTDFLTNGVYGAVFPAANLGSLTAYSNYCVANGIFLSPVYDQQQQANQFLTDIATMTNSEWVWSGTTLKLVPRGDQTITGNGATFTPNLTPLFDLGDVDFITAAGEDPVVCDRVTPADAYNSVKIEIVDRTNAYNTLPIEAKDQSAIEAYGLRQDTSLSAHAITTAAVGQKVAQLILQRDLYVRNTYTFKLGWKYGALDPMDVVTLTDAGLGLNRQLVRIVSLAEDANGVITFTAEQLDVGVAAPAIYASSNGTSGAPNFNAIPPAVNTPIIFDAPLPITSSNNPEIWISASGNGTNWGGCTVWISLDGTTYKNAGRIAGPARMGVLNGAFASGSDPDTTHTLAVDISEAVGAAAIVSGTQTDADLGHTLCYVDGELVSYESATLTSAGHYSLGTYLRRGMYGTANAAHLTAKPFARLDQAIFRYQYQEAQIGSTVKFKFTSFNSFGNNEQSLSAATEYDHVITGPPALPAVPSFAAQQLGTAVAFSWGNMPSAVSTAVKGFDIRIGAAGSSSFSSMTLLTEASRGTEMTTVSVPPGNWTFGIAARDWVDNLGPASFVNLNVTNSQLIVGQDAEAPDFLNSTLVNFGVHYTGVLFPLSSTSCAADLWNTFDQYCPTPYATCTAELTTPLDLGFDGSERIYTLVTAAAGMGVTGHPNVTVQMDYKTNSGAYGGYQAWGVGNVTARFIKSKITETTADGPSCVSVFSPTADSAQITQASAGAGITVAPGGTTITFAPQFHATPTIQVTSIGGTALTATAVSPSSAGFVFRIFDHTGSDVGGTGTWTATGS